jgi:hypothetical protein
MLRSGLMALRLTGGERGLFTVHRIVARLIISLTQEGGLCPGPSRLVIRAHLCRIR